MGRSGRIRRMLTVLAIVATGAWAAMAAAGPAMASAVTAQAAASPGSHHGPPPPPGDTWLPGPASYPSENGLALTPPMGFNDWAHYGCDISQQLLVSTADELVATGLARDGYRYVNIDDCWPAMSRDAAGQLVANPELFPNGLKWLGDYLHARGLKFGIYEDAGTSTCGGYPGSWDHFRQDAETFASWGVDYLKLDGCNVPSVPGQTAEQTYQSAYTQMSQALKATGRPIIFSESAPAYFYGSPGFTQIMSWVGHEGNLWRFGHRVPRFGGRLHSGHGHRHLHRRQHIHRPARLPQLVLRQPDLLRLGAGHPDHAPRHPVRACRLRHRLRPLLQHRPGHRRQDRRHRHPARQQRHPHLRHRHQAITAGA